MEEYRNSQEYIDAFAQYIKSGDDEEIRALLTENVSGTVPVPEFVYDVVKTAWTKDGIMNLVRKSYLKGNLKVGYEIASSGAVIHQEGGDPIDEEQLTLGIVHLVPRNIKKYKAISDELYDLSSRDFLTYVYSELTYQIAKKCGETLIERIVSLSTQSNVPVVDYIDSAITTSTVAMALSKLSDEAVNPVVVMNKGSWGFFKKEQYDNKFGVDVFEGLPVVFNNALKPYNEATTGETFAIVGDFGNGALANYPNGEEVLLKTDELTLAQQDLIKIIGRQYVAVDVVAPKHFAVVNKGDEVTPIVPTGNIEITENGENINVAQYATATVNVAGGGGFINPLIHFNISFENNVTECNMIWEPEPTIVFTTDFAFLVDDQNKLFTRPQLEVFFDSEFPFEWGISLISPYYQEGNSIWILAITASSETQEIKSVTSNDCQVMFNAPTFACAIPNGQSEATVNIVIGNTPK